MTDDELRALETATRTFYAIVLVVLLGIGAAAAYLLAALWRLAE